MKITEGISPLEPVNYLATDLIDDEIKAIYQANSAYFGYEPLLAQLIKELRLVTEALKETAR